MEDRFKLIFLVVNVFFAHFLRLPIVRLALVGNVVGFYLEMTSEVILPRSVLSRVRIVLSLTRDQGGEVAGGKSAAFPYLHRKVPLGILLNAPNAGLQVSLSITLTPPKVVKDFTKSLAVSLAN